MDALHKAKKPTEALLAGRRALDDIVEMDILQDWEWYEKVGRWALHVALRPAITPTQFIPPQSKWYVVVEENYPFGSIKVYPAKHGGINATFQHQSLNTVGTDDVPWRRGDLCVSTNLQCLGREGYDDEPTGAHQRLHWHVGRALEWLIAASNGQLVEPDEPFELPAVDANSSERMIFVENSQRFDKWGQIADQCGLCTVATSEVTGGSYVMGFQSLSGQAILQSNWGTAITDGKQSSKRAVWIRCPQIPVVAPWRFPATWGELRSVLESQGVNFDECCRSASLWLRDGMKHLCLLGYPIPETIGGTARQLHWGAMEFPVLTTPHTKGGFRDDPKRLWQLDRELHFSSGTQIRWANTENWDKHQIQTRGHFEEQFADKRMVLIGVGAVGSILGELLVRGGVTNLILLDGETLTIGNLTRHTLTMNAIDKFKAASVATRLNLISPHARVRGISRTLEKTGEKDRQEISEAEIVWDCTGSNDGFRSLEALTWTAKTVLHSLSLSFGARRLFLFSQQAPFKFDPFANRLQPWLVKDKEEWGHKALPREGIGCWHPVFPASATDIHMMVAMALKGIAEIEPRVMPNFKVFEQVAREGVSVGVQQVEG